MEEILALNRRTIEAFEITDSPVHLEIILSPSGPRVVELACRIGADNIHDAVLQTTGYSLMYEAMKIALGEPRSYSMESRCHTAMQYLLPRSSGIVRRLSFPRQVQIDPDVTEIKLSAKVGSPIAPPPLSFDFLGYVQVRGATRSSAEAKLRKTLEQLEIVVSKDVP